MRVGLTTGALAALALAALAVAAIPATGSGGAADSTAKRADAAKRSTCFKETRTDLGADYVTSLKVKRTSCKKGEKVIKAYHECRRANGGSDGHCRSRVKGYKCKEGKRESTPAQFNAKVRCKKGGKKIVSTYTEQT
ncbi:MAG: hypothetical protein GEU88_00155 [Solirubrobacterales bacterium]|nr:hypothetical protein [Solirubrobacterales bacterium]